MKKLSIIIPVYYNEENLFPLYKDLKDKTLSKLTCEYEVIFVDDGSGDSSYKKMEALAKMDGNIKNVRLSRNFGEHAAILAGLSVCTGDCAVRKAADLQEPSEIILEMYNKYLEGSKVVLAVRTDREEPWHQKLFSGLYTFIIQKLALSNMPKGDFDTFLIDRQIIDLLVSLKLNNTPITELILWSGFKAEMVHYVRKKREIGRSRWTFAKKIKASLDALLGFSYFPIRCISAGGFLTFWISVIWTVILVAQRIRGAITVDGYTTIVILILLSTGIIMFSIGILGEYLWRALDAAKKSPPFIIDEPGTGNKKTSD